jgi:hypothetical protein
MLSPKDVKAAFGDLDDVTVAKIVASGGTPQELAEARAWITSDDALMNAGKPLPAGQVGRLVELLNVRDQEEDLAQDAPS